jgi:hypothetical protein
MQTEGRISPDAWKRRLRVGDKIDAMDKTKNWFEAVVVEVHPQSIKVHFKGWDSKYVASHGARVADSRS